MLLFTHFTHLGISHSSYKNSHLVGYVKMTISLLVRLRNN